MFRSSVPQPVVSNYVRTPFCKAQTSLSDVPAVELAKTAVSEVVDRLPVTADRIDEVVLGCAGEPHDAANIARVAAIEAGIPESVPAFTVQRNCASGMEAIGQAFTKITSGRAKLVVCGGVESMSNYPLLYSEEAQDIYQEVFTSKSPMEMVKAGSKFRPRHFMKPVVSLLEGMTDPTCGLNMGETAEVLASEWDVSREEQDRFALRSHQKAANAWESGRLEDEVIPVYDPDSYEQAVEKDNVVRPDQSMEALEKLSPVPHFFDGDTGTVTPGNASPVTDGAAAMVLVAEEFAEKHDFDRLGSVEDYQVAGLDPKRMGLGPAYATNKLMKENNWSINEFDLIEMNEAFAAQMLANFKAFKSESFAREHLGRDEPLGEISHEKLNVNGGAIALGHPIGATGTRLVGTLLKEMNRRDVKHGLSTLCIGGGQGAAMSLRRS